MEVLRLGYRVPFMSDPPLSVVPIPLPSYSPSSIKGKALQRGKETLIAKGAVKLAPLSPGFYSHLFMVQKASGSWRPVINLVVIEQVRPTYATQDGVQPVGSPVHQEFRLDDLHRSQGCLPSGSNSSIQQEAAEVCC